MPNPLQWLGAFTPKGSTPSDEERQKYDVEQKKRKTQFAQQHPIRSKIGDVVDIGLDFLGGLTGLSDSGSTANKIAQLIEAGSDLIPGKAAASGALSLAGMPLAALRKAGKFKKGLTRADTEIFDLLDDEILRRAGPGNVHGPGVYTFADPREAKGFLKYAQEEGMPKRGRISVIDAEAQNVLDFVEPDPRDIHKIIRAMPEEKSSRYMDYFNELMRQGHTSDEAYKKLAQHIGGVAEEDVLTKAGFDALRYPYGGREAVMFPTSTPIYRMEGETRIPYNKAALAKRREAMAPSGESAITTAPQTITGPSVGAVLPSGRRYIQKTNIPKKEPVEKKMSIAELMALESTKKATEPRRMSLEEYRKKFGIK